jgi:hypothetical protein
MTTGIPHNLIGKNTKVHLIGKPIFVYRVDKKAGNTHISQDGGKYW